MILTWNQLNFDQLEDLSNLDDSLFSFQTLKLFMITLSIFHLIVLLELTKPCSRS